jgi:hypothetical protein
VEVEYPVLHHCSIGCLSWEEALVKENDGIHMNFPSFKKTVVGGESLAEMSLNKDYTETT